MAPRSLWLKAWLFVALSVLGFGAASLSVPQATALASSESSSSAGYVYDLFTFTYDTPAPYVSALSRRSQASENGADRPSPANPRGQLLLMSGLGVAAEGTLPKLIGTEAESFAGSNYSTVTMRAGQRFSRAEEWSASKPGRFLGLEGADTTAEAEQAYNVAKWNNPREVMRSYELTEDTPMYFGNVGGGQGYQALIPEGIDPGSILRFISARVL